jgi:hypothetical protein
MNWPYFEAQWICEEYNKRKIEIKVSRGRPRDKDMGQIKKKLHCKKYQEVSQQALDRVEWRTAVNQS